MWYSRRARAEHPQGHTGFCACVRVPSRTEPHTERQSEVTETGGITTACSKQPKQIAQGHLSWWSRPSPHTLLISMEIPGLEKARPEVLQFSGGPSLQALPVRRPRQQTSHQGITTHPFKATGWLWPPSEGVAVSEGLSHLPRAAQPGQSFHQGFPGSVEPWLASGGHLGGEYMQMPVCEESS